MREHLYKTLFAIIFHSPMSPPSHLFMGVGIETALSHIQEKFKIKLIAKEDDCFDLQLDATHYNTQLVLLDKGCIIKKS